MIRVVRRVTGIAAVLALAGVFPGVLAVVDDRVPPFMTATFPLVTEVTFQPPTRGSKPGGQRSTRS